MSAFQNLSEQKFVEGIYRSVDKNYLNKGSLTENNVPLQFLALVKAGIKKFLDKNPESVTAPLDDLDLPSFGGVPDLVKNMAFEVTPDGYRIVDRASIEDPTSQQLDIDISIPKEFDRLGNILDFPVNLDAEKVTFPNAMLSDEMLDDTMAKVNELMGGASGKDTSMAT